MNTVNVVLVGAIAATAAGPATAPKPVAVAASQMADVDKSLNEAKEAWMKVRRGVTLAIQVLDDESQHVTARVAAAKFLGEVGDHRAIPVLIRHIRLVDPNVGVISGNEDEPLVCVTSLGDCGVAAIPEILDEYLDVPSRNLPTHTGADDIKRHLLLSAILSARDGQQTAAKAKFAITFVRGLIARGDQRLTRARQLELFGYLDETKRHWPPGLRER